MRVLTTVTGRPCDSIDLSTITVYESKCDFSPLFQGGSLFIAFLLLLLWFSVGCFWCQSFGDVSPYVCSYYFLVRFRLLSGHL